MIRIELQISVLSLTSFVCVLAPIAPAVLSILLCTSPYTDVGFGRVQISAAICSGFLFLSSVSFILTGLLLNRSIIVPLNLISGLGTFGSGGYWFALRIATISNVLTNHQYVDVEIASFILWVFALLLMATFTTHSIMEYRFLDQTAALFPEAISTTSSSSRSSAARKFPSLGHNSISSLPTTNPSSVLNTNSTLKEKTSLLSFLSSSSQNVNSLKPSFKAHHQSDSILAKMQPSLLPHHLRNHPSSFTAPFTRRTNNLHPELEQIPRHPSYRHVQQQQNNSPSMGFDAWEVNSIGVQERVLWTLSNMESNNVTPRNVSDSSSKSKTSTSSGSRSGWGSYINNHINRAGFTREVRVKDPKSNLPPLPPNQSPDEHFLPSNNNENINKGRKSHSSINQPPQTPVKPPLLPSILEPYGSPYIKYTTQLAEQPGQQAPTTIPMVRERPTSMNRTPALVDTPGGQSPQSPDWGEEDDDEVLAIDSRALAQYDQERLTRISPTSRSHRQSASYSYTANYNPMTTHNITSHSANASPQRSTHNRPLVGGNLVPLSNMT